MARVCEITGKKRVIGNNVSHSKRRTKREFAPNLRTKKFWLEEENRFVTLKVSAAGIRTINKNGLAAALKSAKVEILKRLDSASDIDLEKESENQNALENKISTLNRSEKLIHSRVMANVKSLENLKGKAENLITVYQ